MKRPRKTVLKQILFSLKRLNDSGLYYGHKKYFHERQSEAMHWITSLLRDEEESK